MQLVVPKALWSKVLEQVHNNSGHLGVKTTLEKLHKRAYRLGYEADVEQ